MSEMTKLQTKKIRDIDEAVLEALRFIQRAEDAKVRIKNSYYALHGCKETSAMRRASMDLTRALVAIRK